MILVDSNVLLDVFGRESEWWRWSLARLEQAALVGPLLINDVIYAETSIRYSDLDVFDATLEDAGITIVPISKLALFRAGKAFAQYRKAGGTRTGVLPDFLIGAHAAVARLPLLTRDVGRYRTYFPTVELIAP